MPKLVKVVARLLRANQIGPISASVSDETFEPRFYQHLHWNRTSPGERDSNEGSYLPNGKMCVYKMEKLYEGH